MDYKTRLFFHSIRKNDFLTFVELLEKGFDANCFEGENRNDYCSLCLACYWCRKEMVEELLKRGISPDGKCFEREDFHCAIRSSMRSGNIDIIKILIQGGAKYNYKLTIDQINSGSSCYNRRDEITFWSDLEIYKINKSEIIPFILSNTKGIPRK